MSERIYTLGHHLVAFLDVLGQREKFRQLRLPKNEQEHLAVQEAMRSTVGFVSNLRDVFRKRFEAFEAGMVNSRIKAGGSLQPSFVALSDSFITSVPLRDDDEFLRPPVLIFSTLSAASAAMLTALASKHALRGGMDVGLGTEMGPGEIYGTALERAYLLESKRADYPRILIGDELWKYLSSCLEEFDKVNNPKAKAMTGIVRKEMQLITTDVDGHRILDYLGPGFANIASPAYATNSVKPAYEFVLDQHAHWVSKGDTKLSERYAKLRRYFDLRLSLWGLVASRS